MMERTRRIKVLPDGTLVDEAAMVRFTTLRRLEQPCAKGPRCTVHPMTETEKRAAWGDR